MYTIPLKREYLPAVRASAKTTTVRAGKRSFPVGRAAIVCGPEEIPIEITDVRCCRYQDLSEGDAIKDGFTSLADLQDALKRFYPDLRPSSDITIVDFHLTP